MGKIIVVMPDEKKREEEVFTNRVFNILRAALRPDENENRSVKSLLIDIVKYRRLTKRWGNSLLFRREIKVSAIRSIYTHLYYNPNEDPIATCHIYSIGQDPETGRTTTDKVFMAFFAIKSPETTELTIETLVEPVTLWLPELKTF